MLDAFILEQLGQISAKKEELVRQLKALTDEEDDENARITQLLDMDDVGKEIFSPRGSNEPLKTKIDGMKRHIDDLLLQEARVRDELEKAVSAEEKYREMLSEARSGETGGSEGQIIDQIARSDVDDQRREELEVILNRISACITYADSDRDKCVGELTNLQYYVKALLSKA